MAHTSQRRNQLSPLCLHLISGQTRPEYITVILVYKTVIVATHHRNYRALSVGTKM